MYVAVEVIHFLVVAKRDSGVHKQASAMLEVRPLACLIRGRVLACLLDSTEDA